MKKILLFAFAVMILSTFAQAQIEKGTVLLGGNLSLSSNKSENVNQSNTYNDKTTNFGISPSIGVAVKTNTILGIQFGYVSGKNTTKSATTQSQDYKSYGGEFFLRRYFTLGKGFYLFAQPGIYFNRTSIEHKYLTYEQTSKSWSTGINLYPGISYAVSKRFHLEASLGDIADLSYSKSAGTNKLLPGGETSTSKGSGFSISSSLSNSTSVSIGFRFLLGKKAKA